MSTSAAFRAVGASERQAVFWETAGAEMKAVLLRNSTLLKMMWPYIGTAQKWVIPLHSEQREKDSATFRVAKQMTSGMY